MNLYEGHIFMFGGLIEVTQESSELFLFDLEANYWTLLKSKEIEEQKAKNEETKLLHVPLTESFNDNQSSEKDKRSSNFSRQEEQAANMVKRRNIKSAVPGNKPSSLNVGTLSSDA